jgi:hypothetical protein
MYRTYGQSYLSYKKDLKLLFHLLTVNFKKVSLFRKLVKIPCMIFSVAKPHHLALGKYFIWLASNLLNSRPKFFILKNEC